VSVHKATTHPWEVPKLSWHRLHVDFTGPYMDSMFLVVVDAFSKWIEIVVRNTITLSATIEKLQDIFAHTCVQTSIDCFYVLHNFTFCKDSCESLVVTFCV